MSRRVTRASAARLNADLNSAPSPPSATETGSTATPRTTPATRKRKPAAEPSPSYAQRETRRSKRARGADAVPEAPVAEPSPKPRKSSKKETTAAMSSAGYGGTSAESSMATDVHRHSSSTSGELSPQQVPRDSTRRKSGRTKSKEDASGSNSASGSRRSRKTSKKDHDVFMKDVDEKGELPDKSPHSLPSSKDAEHEEGENEEQSKFAAAPYSGGSKMEDRDPFSSDYLSRLTGGAGLSGSLRALSGFMSGTHSRLRNILEQLKMKEDSTMQLVALQELSELLLVSNEDNLAGHFVPDQFVKELVVLMQPNELTGEENPEIMLLACRCIANLMEALPASTASVVYGGAVPVLCQKLLEINFIDLAEQALSTLEKISAEFPSSIVREGGLTACLTYLDFFATSTQRIAVTTAANCCRNIPDDSFPTVRDVMPILLNTLSSSDQRVVEQASLCVSRVIDSFKYQEARLEELVSPELLKAVLRLLLPGSTNMIGSHIHTQFLKVLSITARASPRLSTELLKMNVVDTLYQILTGVSPPADTDVASMQIDKNIIMQAIIKTPREQIYETLNVICELLPNVARDDLTFLDDLYDAGYASVERVSMSTRSKKSPNDKRLEFYKTCPAEIKRFTVILFPTLMYAFTSTVNLNVRQKVLTAQLKMLSNIDTDILIESLRGVTYASHLASILTQQDHVSLVTYALQAAELLLKRLETIYRPQFYREGVMAEISKLANRPLKDGGTIEVVKISDEIIPREDEPITRVEILEQHDEPITSIPKVVEVADVHAGLEVAVEDDRNDNIDERHDEDDEEDVDDGAEDDYGDEGDDDGEGTDQSGNSDPHSSNLSRHLTDVQDVVTMRAKRFVETHETTESALLQDKAAHTLSDLSTLASELKSCYTGSGPCCGIDLFRRLAGYFNGDAMESITSYELMSSGIVDVLLHILSRSDERPAAAENARSDFLQAFMEPKNDTRCVKSEDKSPATAFSILLHKLQDLLSRAEHFEVITVQHNGFENNRNSAASMLAKQLRLHLVADEDSGIPRPYRTIIVSIHAIATFKALDDYLRPRISLADRSGIRNRDGISGAMAAYAAVMSGRSERLENQSSARMTSGSSLPTRISSKIDQTQKSSQLKSNTESNDHQGEEEKPRLRRSSRRHSTQTPASATIPSQQDTFERKDGNEDMQDALECADEVEHESGNEDEDIEADLDAIVDDLEDGAALGAYEPDPTAVNMEVAKSGRVTARTEDGVRVSTPSGSTPAATPTTRDRMTAHARLSAAREILSTPTSSSRPMPYSMALQQIPQDWHIEFSVNGQPISSEITIYRACHYNNSRSEQSHGRTTWSSTHTIKFKRVQGPPPAEKSSNASSQDQAQQENEFPSSLDNHPISSTILRLMSILHNLNDNLADVFAEYKINEQLRAEPLSQFINTKLTAKLNRQLEEPLIVASQCLPSWSEDLARIYPFLFPFETRHLFLQSTSFGYSRSMARWQGSSSENETRRQRDDRLFLGRAQRQKVRISRSRILESAIKVMELYGQSSSILEVEYFEEVGTGLGPTLEFYSTVSKEFSKKKTKMWRENESFETGEYAFGRGGLFPAPMSEDMAKDENGQKVLHLFRMLGKLVARSMLDSRIIDVSFNPVFFRVGEDRTTVNPSLATVAAVDRDLAKSLKVLKKYVAAKQRIDEDTHLSPSQKATKIDNIRINDALIDDLSLDFTLPGYPQIKLSSGGAKDNVTIDNVNEYIQKVIDMTLNSGVRRQVEAFRAGFSQVFPYSALRAFTPDELVMLFGRVEEDWSLETLTDSIKADHGYNIDSRTVRNLLQVMSSLSPQGKRDFLQFITGSPKLPIGGFKALTPLFTVVCRPSEPPYTPDDCLPTVMTCVNYLKLPDYSTIDILRAKLNVAIKEGQGAFHLS